MIRSVLALVAGLAVIMIVVMAGTVAATALFAPGGLSAAMQQPTDPTAPLPAAYLLANLAVSFAAAVVGGWTTRRVAISAKNSHVLILAALVILLAVPSALRAGSMGQPDWYGWVIAAVGVVGVVAGGWRRV